MRLISAIALVMSCLLTLTPILVLAQQANIAAEARAAAEADAKANVNTKIWFTVGCLGGWMGLVVSYLYQPSPPAGRLVGKSPEYVAAYTDAYKEAAKKIQTKWAWTGCLTAGAVYVVSYLLLIAAAVEATEEPQLEW